MLLTNTTQTLNVDIWNYWHFAFTGALTAIYTGSFAVGMIAAIINMIIIMVLADITAGKVEESLGIPGVSLPHGFSTAYAPIAMAFNWLIDKIPGVRDIDFNFENLREKIGILGEPMMIGSIIGLVIGIVAGYDVAGVLGLGVSLGAVLVLIPKMAAMLMEGLEPISEAAGEFIKKRFSNRGKMYIGLDSAIGVGHPVTLTIAYLLMPLALILAIALPGNKVMPFTDLSVLPFMILLIAPIVNNNGFRTLLIGIIFLIFGLYISTDLAPLITQAAMNVGFQMPEGANMISCISDGASPLTWALVNVNRFGTIGIVLVSIFAIALALWNRKRIIKEANELENN
jgi:PTS system, IIc component